MKNDKKDFAYAMGWICGRIVVACLALCLASIMVALTLKFLFWIF